MTTLYRKDGRRYVPVLDLDLQTGDKLKLGEFRLTYAYRDGGRRYSYDVRPDTAGFLAAAEIARHAMEERMNAMAQSCTMQMGRIPLNARQKRAVSEAKAILADAGLAAPHWWSHASSRDIAEAGIEAVRTFAP